jgi:hypothetical protein
VLTFSGRERHDGCHDLRKRANGRPPAAVVSADHLSGRCADERWMVGTYANCSNCQPLHGQPSRLPTATIYHSIRCPGPATRRRIRHTLHHTSIHPPFSPQTTYNPCSSDAPINMHVRLQAGSHIVRWSDQTLTHEIHMLAIRCLA